jgi:hypothetical protein
MYTPQIYNPSEMQSLGRNFTKQVSSKLKQLMLKRKKKDFIGKNVFLMFISMYTCVWSKHITACFITTIPQTTLIPKEYFLVFYYNCETFVKLAFPSGSCQNNIVW